MSNSSGQYSPDWLGKATTTSSPLLFTSSESVPYGSPSSDDDQLAISSVIKKTSQVKSPSTKRKGPGESGGNKGVGKGKTSKKLTKSQEPKTEEDHAEESKSPTKKKLKMEDMETKQESVKVLEKQTTEKQTGSYISSSRLPLVLADKVQRSKALVECEGESIDLSGDLGSVGRVVVSSANQDDVLLDLKGTIYKMTILPSTTFCVVSFGQSEAKIEAIMDDFIQLKPQSNVYEAETMVEGTLEGYSFDSEDEADKTTNRQTVGDDAAQPQTNGKGKAVTTSVATKRKQGKTAAARKPAKRKAPAAKKSKPKK